VAKKGFNVPEVTHCTDIQTGTSVKQSDEGN
jgi:hypothetical protein